MQGCALRITTLSRFTSFKNVGYAAAVVAHMAVKQTYRPCSTCHCTADTLEKGKHPRCTQYAPAPLLYAAASLHKLQTLSDCAGMLGAP